MKRVKKILLNEVFNLKITDDLIIPSRRIVYCYMDKVTSRSVHTTELRETYYIGSVKNQGCDYYRFTKSKALNLKKLDLTQYFRQKGLWPATWNYIFSKPELCKNLKADVMYFDRSSGDGMVFIPKLNRIMKVYACNIAGKKTWYPETACMYLNKGQDIMIDLTGDSFQQFIVVNQGGIFDADKWNSLDHDKLAFKCNENGDAINGLF